jgi:uncharacterized lipoprotein NlpE involved in copper resistance
MSISKDLVDVIKSSAKKDTKPYDTQATVTRIEGSTVWVHIPGGVDETPVKKTVSAKEGDVVQVRVSGGSAYLMGNASSPPTDDTTALLATEYARTANAAAESAVQSAKNAGEAAAEAGASAEAARNLAVLAKSHADEAGKAADSAVHSANDALTQLGIVENVIGTLNWISEHGTYSLTTDTEIVQGKVYFTRTGSGTSQDPYIYYPVVEPKAEELGSYYELYIDDAVSSYVASHLSLTERGLYVMNDQTDWKVLIANDGVYILDDKNKTVAKYKDVITLGMDDGSESYIRLDYHSLQMIDKEGNTYFYVSDLRDSEGIAEIQEVYLDNAYIYLTYRAKEIISIVADGVTLSESDYTVESDRQEIRFKRYYDEIKATYTTDNIVTAYTLGNRHKSGHVGANSIAMGRSVIASMPFAIALGLSTEANGRASLAAGVHTETTGSYAVAFGSTGKAIGFGSAVFGGGCKAKGMFSFADGEDCETTGRNSHAMNRGTIARCGSQTVMGQYNVPDSGGYDSRGKLALIVGNGTDDDNRSNAFAVDWNGIPYCRNKRNDYDSIFNLIYPVGSIYMSVNNVSPATLFGGTWEQIQDRFLLAAGSNYSAGSTGGSANASLPAHTHSVSGTAASGGAHTHTVSGTAASNGAHTHSMNKLWSNGSGKETAYTMQSNRTLTTRNTASAGAHTHTVSGTAASNGAHTHSVSGTAASQGVDSTGKNMPPYLTVYMWKRTG